MPKTRKDSEFEKADQRRKHYRALVKGYQTEYNVDTVELCAIIGRTKPRWYSRMQNYESMTVGEFIRVGRKLHMTQADVAVLIPL